MRVISPFRPRTVRSSARTSAALAVAAAAAFVVPLLAPSVARADAWGSNKGKIFVSDTEFGQGFASDAAMVSAMKKQSKTAIKGDGGAWNLNFMVFLKEAPGAATVNIVYYDVTGKRDQVNYSEISVKPDQKIVQLNGVSISKDLGFVKGHKYEVLATRIIGGKEKVYAKAVITLK